MVKPSRRKNGSWNWDVVRKPRGGLSAGKVREATEVGWQRPSDERTGVATLVGAVFALGEIVSAAKIAMEVGEGDGRIPDDGFAANL